MGSVEEQIEANMGLVVSVANKYAGNDAEKRDRFIQCGRIGLWQAIESYDPARGTRFSTHACNLIRYKILDEIKKDNKKIKNLPLEQANPGELTYTNNDRLWECLPNLTDTEKEALSLKLQGHTYQEISQQLGLSVSRVAKLFKIMRKTITEHEKEESFVGN